MRSFIVAISFVLWVALGHAQTTGVITRGDCDNIPSGQRVTNATACFQTTTAAGRTAGEIYVWDGGSWAQKTSTGAGGGDVTGITGDPQFNITNGGGPVPNIGFAATIALNASAVTVKDTGFIIQDDVDATKQAEFVATNITTGTKRFFTFPDVGGTLALTTSNVASATALAANPTDCAAGQYARLIDAEADLTCFQVQFSELGGTAANAQIVQSNVTQHQAALSITESQISDLGTYLAAGDSPTLTGTWTFNVAPSLPSNTIDLLDIKDTECIDGEIIKKAGGVWACGADAGAGSGNAPQDGEYITYAANATLSAERVATTTATIAVDLGTADEARWNVVADSIGPTQIDETAAYTWSGNSTFSGVNNVTGTSPLTLDGVTADANKITVTVTDPTASRLFTLPDADSVAVQSSTAVANQFLTGITSLGVITRAQPAFTDISGSVTDAQVPDTITINLAAQATSLASNGANCSAGNAPLGVDASGASEGCFGVVPTAGGTMTGQLVASNLGVEFTESDTNPTCAAGNYTIYADLSETKLKKCENGTLADLGSGGGGGGTVTTSGTMTNTAIVTSVGGTVIQTPNASTTIDTSGNISTPGSVSTGAGSGVAGGMKFAQGTAGTLGSNHVLLQAPTSVVTSYSMALPTAAGTGFLLNTNSGVAGTLSFVSATGTGNVVRSTSPTLVTPNIGVATATSLTVTGLTASRPAIVNGSQQLATGTYSGNTTTLATTSGTLTQNNQATFDANGNLIASASPVGAASLALDGSNSMTGIINASNLGIDFAESDTNPACAAGDYRIYSDLSETKLKKCQNGTVTDLDAGGGSVTNIATSSPIQGGPITATGTISCPTCTTDTNTQTLTNKTLDTEATGNAITIAHNKFYPGAGCNNATPGTVWDLPTATAAVPICVTGTNIQKGVLQYADSAGGFSAQLTDFLDGRFTTTGGVDVGLLWTTSATTGNAKWTIQFVCTAVNATATDDPAFPTSGNGFVTITTAAPGTANQVQTSSALAQSVPSSCVTATPAIIHFRVFRDGADAADTITASANMIGLSFTHRKVH